MIKKRNWILLMLIVVLSSACSNDDSIIKNEPTGGQKENVINLQQLSFTEMKDLLAGKSTLKNIVFQDGDLVKKVSELKLDDQIVLKGIDTENNTTDQTFFYHGNPTDSLLVALSNESFSLKLVSNSNEIAYVAYANPKKTDEVLESIQKEVPQTRGGPEIFTRGSSQSNFFRMNITEAQKTKQHENALRSCEMLTPEKSEVNEEAPTPTTRTAYYAGEYPRGNEITIHLIRDENDWPWEHEITWQVNDLVTSLKAIRSDLKVTVWRSTVGFRGSSDGRLDELARFTKGYDFPWKESVGKDIIMAVRHYGYDNFIGIAYVGAYKLSRLYNLNAYGLVSTSALYPRTLAHEVGHLLGAGHVPEHPWYMKLFWNDDIMIATNNWFVGYVHQDYDNIRIIRSNLY